MVEVIRTTVDIRQERDGVSERFYLAKVTQAVALIDHSHCEKGRSRRIVEACKTAQPGSLRVVLQVRARRLLVFRKVVLTYPLSSLGFHFPIIKDTDVIIARSMPLPQQISGFRGVFSGGSQNNVKTIYDVLAR